MRHFSLVLLSFSLATPARPQDPPPNLVRRSTSTPGVEVLLDLAPQRLHLDIPEERGVGRVAGAAEEQIAPRRTELPSTRQGFVSAAELGLVAKRFDDGLLAAVERAADVGAGEFPGISQTLTAWAARSTEVSGGDREAGYAILLAAQALGAKLVPATPTAEAAREATWKSFLADEARSKPLGFYTWSGALERIFRRDRLLQERCSASELERVLSALRGDAELRARYERWLALAGQMTNGFAALDLARVLAGEAIPRDGAAILPPSRSFEGDLVKRLYGASPIPPGFELAQALVDGVRGGTLSLAPRASSGWYDHIAYSLEPLAAPERMPEAARLELSERYRAELVGLLKGLLALARETHVKQLEIPTVGSAMPRFQAIVRPELRVEPLPTHYLRRARAYEFLERVLVNAFGAEALAARRVLREGEVEGESIAEALAAQRRLFLGAALCASEDLGLAPRALDAELVDDPAARAAFLEWSERRQSDPELGADVRMMVPIFYDVERRRTKVWVVLGWTRKPLLVTFAVPPHVRLVGEAVASEEVDLEFRSSSYDLAYPVTAEVYVQRLLDRAELRALCDREKTQQKILQALASLR
ncbi:MAG: hypothetical protein JNM84_20715 [Planctomycetes bacterium]|nr:hypothetical protein [Planctomycetota bacterium]